MASLLINGANVRVTLTNTVTSSNNYGVGATASAIMVRNSTVSNNAVEFRRSGRDGAGRSDNDHIEWRTKTTTISGNTTDGIAGSMLAAVG